MSQGPDKRRRIAIDAKRHADVEALIAFLKERGGRTPQACFARVWMQCVNSITCPASSRAASAAFAALVVLWTCVVGLLVSHGMS